MPSSIPGGCEIRPSPIPVDDGAPLGMRAEGGALGMRDCDGGPPVDVALARGGP
jgi:hypothetical protein